MCNYTKQKLLHSFLETNIVFDYNKPVHEMITE